ncbi:MAG: alkaline phosphatase family protein, partial [Anaerolineae bacterium]|nr:alkaline phosphatase family protein [Anaerolineae bacterium]
LTSSPTSTPTTTPTPIATATPTATPTPEPEELKYVVLISIDGLRPDALEIADTPSLDALRVAGAYSPRARSVLPSVTLVNHASMLGGMGPDKHGITWNVLDPEAGKINGPTLFTVAHDAGLTSMMVVGKPKLDHIVLPGSVDNFIHAGYTDRPIVNQALDIVETDLPDILFIHLPDVDSAGHATGWMQPGQLAIISLTDGLIGEIVAGLKAQDVLKNTLLIITSDHGGSGLAHGTASAEDATIPWLAVGPGIRAGSTIEQDIVMYDTAATILYALGLPIPDQWDGKPITEIFIQPEP